MICTDRRDSTDQIVACTLAVAVVSGVITDTEHGNWMVTSGCQQSTGFLLLISVYVQRYLRR